MRRLVSIIATIAVLSLSIVAAPPASADSSQQSASAAWFGEYFGNPFLSNTPVFTRQDAALAFNWGSASPGQGMPADNFSIRWGANPYFKAGTYRFSILADDGFALTIDFQNVVFNTLDAPKVGQTLTADVTLTEGVHHLQVDFRELGGVAYIYLNWVPITSIPNQPPTLPVNEIAAYVNTNRLNVRTGPSLGYSIVSVVTQNQILRLLGRDAAGTWVLALLPNSTQGWVSSAYLVANTPITNLPVSTIPPTNPPPPVTGLAGTVNTGALNVRTGPGITFGVVTSVGNGTPVTIIGRTSDSSWVEVLLANGSRGWVNARYVYTTGSIWALPVTYGNPTPPPTQTTHVVQRGETLFRIAVRYGVSLQALILANGIVDPSRIYAGQVLIIPR